MQGQTKRNTTFLRLRKMEEGPLYELLFGNTPENADRYQVSLKNVRDILHNFKTRDSFKLHNWQITVTREQRAQFVKYIETVLGSGGVLNP